MTALEVDKALTDIVLKRYAECESRLNKIEKSLKTERKAIQIELGMYGLCLRAGLLYYTIGSREDTLKHFSRQAEAIFSSFPKILKVYKEANDEEKLIMIAALRQEAFMRNQFSSKNEEEYQRAQELGYVSDAFELNIKINAINSVYKEWEAWRENNIKYSNMFR